jgi:hypothetical protein
MEEKVSKEWTDYILGRSGKPCMYQLTLISESHSEPAKIKPVVWGRCGNGKTKIFIDSGAELNVIDGDLFNQLLKKQVPVKSIPSTSTIACANGSKMHLVIRHNPLNHHKKHIQERHEFVRCVGHTEELQQNHCMHCI